MVGGLFSSKNHGTTEGEVLVHHGIVESGWPKVTSLHFVMMTIAGLDPTTWNLDAMPWKKSVLTYFGPTCKLEKVMRY